MASASERIGHTSTERANSPTLSLLSSGRNSIPIQPLQSHILFDKYVFPANSQIPHTLALRGAIAITRDSIGVTFMHKFLRFMQRVHAWLFGRKTDHHLCHAMVVIEKDVKKENHLIVAHGSRDEIDGTRIDSLHDLNDPSVTELYVYVPRDDALKKLLCHHSALTAIDTIKQEAENKLELGGRDELKKIAPFSIFDMATSLFYNSESFVQTEKVAKRISYAVSDLLLRQQILDRNGNPKGFFCMPYVATILQASLLVNVLQKTNPDLVDVSRHIRTRDEIAGEIQALIGNGTSNANEVAKTFWEHPLFSFNNRYVMSCYAGEALDRVSMEMTITKS